MIAGLSKATVFYYPVEKTKSGHQTRGIVVLRLVEYPLSHVRSISTIR
jgi:hypothetical protein